MPKRILFASSLFWSMILFPSLTTYAQQTQQDSTSTPFRKGRWLTGLAGSISSTTSVLGSAGGSDFTSQYSFDISNGKFVSDRWLVGVLFFANRDNSEGLVSRESETLFIGPSIAHYLSNLEYGSVFVKVAPGYAQFRERVSTVQNGSTTQNRVEGSGIGGALSLGYSYVIHDRIAFDLGVNINTFWIGAERSVDPDGLRSDETINVSDIAFFLVLMYYLIVSSSNVSNNSVSSVIHYVDNPGVGAGRERVNLCPRLVREYQECPNYCLAIGVLHPGDQCRLWRRCSDIFAKAV